MRLVVGDDWAEDHHDIEVMDQAGKVLAKRRLPEGVAGMTQLHGLIDRFLPEAAEDAEVVIGIETDPGPWVAALRGEHLGQPPALTAAYAATARSLIAVITTLNEQVTVLKEQVGDHFGRHPDAEIYQSQPGMAAILGARVLGKFGDDPDRYPSTKACRNYGGTSPIIRASGKEKVAAARFIHNDRLIDALMAWAFASLTASPSARAYYDEQRAKGLQHHDVLRRQANGLPGILHGCLKTRTLYHEATA